MIASFATSTRSLQFLVFPCHLSFTGITKFKEERKNKMNSGASCNCKKWPVMVIMFC